VRILVADDEPVSRRTLQSMLEDWGYSVRVCTDGAVAWGLLQRADAPPLVILDWVMPRMNGLEVCRKLRSVSALCPTYVLLVTAKDQNADLVTGLHAGADDYITKPFNREELRARVQVGERVVELQRRLAERVRELEEALADVKHLSGLLPICAYCKKIRNDQNYWQQVECYVSEHSEAQFSHGICPDCYETVVKTELSHLRINES
jgi:DNA-binding response OmpR family regulator